MKKTLVVFAIVAFSAVSCTKVIRNPASEQEIVAQAPAEPEISEIEMDSGAASQAAAAAQAKEIAQNLSDQLRFQTDSAELKEEAVAGLQELGKVAAQDPNVNLKVSGFTDSTGSVKHNEKLSLERAKSVQTVLAQSGIPTDRLSVEGMAENNPVADNATSAGRAQNRRVEIEIS